MIHYTSPTVHVNVFCLQIWHDGRRSGKSCSSHVICLKRGVCAKSNECLDFFTRQIPTDIHTILFRAQLIGLISVLDAKYPSTSVRKLTNKHSLGISVSWGTLQLLHQRRSSNYPTAFYHVPCPPIGSSRSRSSRWATSASRRRSTSMAPTPATRRQTTQPSTSSSSLIRVNLYKWFLCDCSKFQSLNVQISHFCWKDQILWTSYDHYFVIKLNFVSEDLTGCGLSFTLGRGNELVMHAVDSLRFLAVDRFVIDIQGLSE